MTSINLNSYLFRLKANNKRINLFYTIGIILCFLPFISPIIALLIGILFSTIGINNNQLKKYSSFILQASIVCLGFGMNLNQIIKTSANGFIETLISVSSVMILGIVLGKIFKVNNKISFLISSGTAICGGSAIAAIAPIVKSDENQTSFALIVIFVLNALALILFPYLGFKLELSQYEFGNWAAIAIHDTSSVVGAGAVYGEEALQIATTVKLIRALWIIPLSLVISIFVKKDSKKQIKIPWFIFLFVVAIFMAYLFPQYNQTYLHFAWLGKKGMLVALFVIGSSFSLTKIKQAGFNSFLLGVILWISISLSSLFLIRL